jgi:aryl-alcohol dehydrogenase-like predicted oxidoreductase/enamine deaminase RidA (YjgF/YER057c/UK114 family)
MSTTIPRIELAPGLEIARLVTGLWQVADMERDGRTLDLDAAATAMHPYVERGATTFDMADHYGSAEDITGRYVAAHGATGAQFLTKWVPRPGALTRADVRAGVERALTRMRLERLPLLQFHAWRYADPSWLDALWWLEELRAEGLVGAIGVTNLDTAHLRVATASGIRLASNQVSCSLLDRRALGAMSDYCRAHGIGILAYGTVAGGLLTERWVGAADPAGRDDATWSMMKYRRFIEQAGGWEALQALLVVVQGIARRHGVSMANVATRWILDHPAIAAVIVGARLGERNHLDDNARTFAFALDDDDRAALARATGALPPIPGDCGDEYRKPPFLTASGDLSHHLDGFPPAYAVVDAGDRRRALSGTSWETMAGYCRAVRVGDRILVSGTTATYGDRLVGGTDAGAQAHAVLDKIEGAITSLGGRMEDVVRTRVFVKEIGDWEPVARAHGERFGTIQPANTLVQARLVGDEYLVEIEAEAVVPGSRG